MNLAGIVLAYFVGDPFSVKTRRGKEVEVRGQHKVGGEGGGPRSRRGPVKTPTESFPQNMLQKKQLLKEIRLSLRILSNN